MLKKRLKQKWFNIGFVFGGVIAWVMTNEILSADDPLYFLFVIPVLVWSGLTYVGYLDLRDKEKARKKAEEEPEEESEGDEG